MSLLLYTFIEIKHAYVSAINVTLERLYFITVFDTVDIDCNIAVTLIPSTNNYHFQ